MECASEVFIDLSMIPQTIFVNEKKKPDTPCVSGF